MSILYGHGGRPRRRKIHEPAAVPDQQNEEYVESEVLLEETSSESSTNVGTMDESVADDAVPDQHNEESSEYEIIT